MTLSKENIFDEGDYKSSEEEVANKSDIAPEIANKFNIVPLDANGGGEIENVDEEEKKSKTIEIIGSNGASVVMEKNAAKRLIQFVQDLLEGDESATEIKVHADQQSLDHLLQYVEYHATHDPEPTPLPVLRPSTALAKILKDQWDVNFLQPLSAVETMNLIKVADKLNVEGLLDILRAFLASQLFGLSDEELKIMIKTGKWPHDAYCGGEDVNLSASEETDVCDGDDNDNIRSLDALLLEDERIEQQAPVLLKPNDFHTMKCVVAQNTNAILRLQKLLNELNVDEETSIFAISKDFYQSVLNYSLYHPDLTVSREELKNCKLAMNAMVQDTRILDIKQVDAKTLKWVVKWLKYHRGVEPAEIAKPIRSVIMERIVEDVWDADFINSALADSKRTVFQMILAANYMDIKGLLHLGCAKVATMIKGKSPEEIRTILGEEDE